VSLIAAATVITVSATGGFGSAPGRFTFTDKSANASFFNPVDNSSESIFVDHSLSTVRPPGQPGFVPQEMTTLSIFIDVPDVDPSQPPVLAASGCFVIPDSAFVVSRDLGSATLNATVNESDTCPFFSVPFGNPGAAAAGPGGGGFTFPLIVTGSWTGTGVTAMSDDQGTFRCAGFVSTTHNQTRSQFSAAVTVSISGFGTFTGPPNSFGGVSVSNQTFDVVGTGVISPACGGKGG
jgi:hypothetical protein